MSKTETTMPQSGPGEAPDVLNLASALGRDLKDHAGDLAKNAAEAVKEQAGHLTDSAKVLASEAGDKLRTSVTEQKAFGADYVQGIAGMIRRSASAFDSELPQAGEYIRKAAFQLETASEAVRNRDVSEIVHNVQDFARKQPTMFFGAAVLLGFAAVRFLKSGSGGQPQSSTEYRGPQ